MISAILFTATILALVSLTAWIVNRTFKENQKLIEMTREADCERMGAIENARGVKCELERKRERLWCIESVLPSEWEVRVANGQAIVYAVHKDRLLEKTSVRCYPYDVADPESKDFARRNAEKLVEILKREAV